jgi:hypothetical protein
MAPPFQLALQMRLPTPAILLLLTTLPLGVVAAQPGGKRSIPLTLGTDTVEMVLRAQSRGGEQPTFRMVQTLSRGTGADAGALIQSAVINVMAEDGRVIASTVDTVVVDSMTLRFRRAAGHRYDVSGNSNFASEATVSGGVISHRERTDSGVSTKTLPVPAGESAPLTSPDLILRSSPLSPTFTTAFDVYIASVNQMMHITVDSVRSGTDAGRRVWRLYAHPERATRFRYTIDSLTRDMTRFDVYDSTGSQVAGYTHQRYARGRDAAATPASVASPATLPSAADVERVAGHYYLEGVREVGSELLLRPNGTFEFMLAYGALDESGAGAWSVVDGDVILQSAGVAHRPTVTLAAASGVATTSIRIVVSDTHGQPVNGIEVDAVRPKSGTSFAKTRAGEYVLHFERGDTPTELSVGYDVMNLMFPFPLGRAPKALYRFVFDRGDLGVRRFDATALTVDTNQLTMTMNGRSMSYVRH